MNCYKRREKCCVLMQQYLLSTGKARFETACWIPNYRLCTRKLARRTRTVHNSEAIARVAAPATWRRRVEGPRRRRLRRKRMHHAWIAGARLKESGCFPIRQRQYWLCSQNRPRRIKYRAHSGQNTSASTRYTFRLALNRRRALPSPNSLLKNSSSPHTPPSPPRALLFRVGVRRTPISPSVIRLIIYKSLAR